MSNQTNHGKTLTVSILSLSLLTVMAGAAVAPALSVIQAHFADTNQFFVQMIISVPALFIVITNFIFPEIMQTIWGEDPSAYRPVVLHSRRLCGGTF